MAGNRGGPGNPYAGKTAALRNALVNAVTPGDMADIAEALIAKAKGGDTAASRLLFSYILGKPTAAGGGETQNPMAPADQNPATENLPANPPNLSQELPGPIQTKVPAPTEPKNDQLPEPVDKGRANLREAGVADQAAKIFAEEPNAFAAGLVDRRTKAMLRLTEMPPSWSREAEPSLPCVGFHDKEKKSKKKLKHRGRAGLVGTAAPAVS